MGRLLASIKKNVKLMTRTKSSAFLVVIGPILLVLLVGLAFNTKSLYELNVGITGGVNTDLRTSMINSLQNKSYLVLEFESQQECIEKIKQGVIHTCIVIPNNFDVNSNNVITFYVDNSRPNLVWKVIGAISEETSLRAEELSYQLSSDLLRVLNDVKVTANDNIEKIILLKQSIDSDISKLEEIKSKANSINLGEASIDYSQILTDLQEINSSALSMRNTISNKVEDILADSNASTAHDEAKTINLTASDYYSSLNSQIISINADLESLDSQLSNLNQDIKSAMQNAEDIKSNADKLIKELNNVKSQLDSLKQSYESMINEIDNIKVKSAEKIAQPVETSIKTVATNDTQLLYMSPYLLMLLVMLVGLMISGTMVVMEKKSKAMFRNYTVPTKRAVFISSYYFTSLFLLLLEVILISAISYIFLDGNILHSLDKLFLFILLSASLFVLIGIILGYLADAQEGLTIGSLSLGILLLFLSNLVLPLESMSPLIRDLAKYNPYVISSETARKIILFNASWKELLNPALYLLLYIVVSIFLIFLAEKLSFKSLMKKSYKEKLFLSVNGIIIKDETIISKKDLANLLKKISDEEFIRLIKKNKSLRKYASKVWKDKELLKHLNSRQELLNYILNKKKE